MAIKLKDELTRKDTRILNAMRANPEMRPQEIRDYLGISEESYLNTMSKPCVKAQIKLISQEMLELSRITRTQQIINDAGNSIQASKLAAELAGEVGRLQTAPSDGEVKNTKDTNLVQIRLDYESGNAVIIPDLSAALRKQSPKRDNAPPIPDASENILIVSPGQKDTSKKLKSQAQTIPIVKTEDNSAGYKSYEDIDKLLKGSQDAL